MGNSSSDSNARAQRDRLRASSQLSGVPKRRVMAKLMAVVRMLIRTAGQTSGSLRAAKSSAGVVVAPRASSGSKRNARKMLAAARIKRFAGWLGPFFGVWVNIESRGSLEFEIGRAHV